MGTGACGVQALLDGLAQMAGGCQRIHGVRQVRAGLIGIECDGALKRGDRIEPLAAAALDAGLMALADPTFAQRLIDALRRLPAVPADETRADTTSANSAVQADDRSSEAAARLLCNAHG